MSLRFDQRKGIPPIMQVMTPFPYSIEAGAGLEKALAMMGEHDFRHLPVVEGGELVGVVSEREILRAAEGRRGKKAEEQLSVRDVALLDAYIVGLLEPLDSVVEHMAREHLGAALVVKDGRLAGIFTITDACQWFAEFLRARFPSEKGDDAA